MSQPTQGDVHVNGPLTQISIAYMQSAMGFVADRVFPNIPVSKQSDVYYTYDRTFFNRNEMEVRAPGTRSKRIGYEVSTSPYFANVYAIGHDIPDQVRANADSVIGPDRDATMLVSQQAMLKREVEWASNYFGPSIWGTDQTSGSDWDAMGDPIPQIRAAKTAVLQATGVEPNTLVLGKGAADLLIDNAAVVDRVIYGAQQSVSVVRMPQIAALLEIDRIFVMSAIQNTAEEGAAESNSFIGTSLDALLCYAAPSPGLMTPSAGYTFSWTGMMGSGAMGGRIKRFRQEDIESDTVEIQMAFDQKLVAADLGYYFDDVTAT
jgi:hypothetical protein